MLQIVNQEKSKKIINIIYIFHLISALKWKGAIDEAALFLDGGKLPCLLVENKVDLVDFEDDPSILEFAKNNEFCGAFRTSSKTGFNVCESMEYLIRNIIKRMKDFQAKQANKNKFRCIIY